MVMAELFHVYILWFAWYIYVIMLLYIEGINFTTYQLHTRMKLGYAAWTNIYIR